MSTRSPNKLHKQINTLGSSQLPCMQHIYTQILYSPSLHSTKTTQEAILLHTILQQIEDYALTTHTHTRIINLEIIFHVDT